MESASLSTSQRLSQPLVPVPIWGELMIPHMGKCVTWCGLFSPSSHDSTHEWQDIALEDCYFHVFSSKTDTWRCRGSRFQKCSPLSKCLFLSLPYGWLSDSYFTNVKWACMEIHSKYNSEQTCNRGSSHFVSVCLAGCS